MSVEQRNNEAEHTHPTDSNAPISENLKKHYDKIAKRYPIRTDDNFSTLVIPTGNDSQPFHRWFHLKEGFAWNLSQVIVSTTNLSTRKRITFVDPFLGTGSSMIGLLRSQEPSFKYLHAYGIERNPFLKFVASTMVQALRKRTGEFEQFADNVIKEHQATFSSDIEIPTLSTFNNEDYFSEGTVQSLVNLKQCINNIAKNNLNKNLGLLCLSSIVEAVSFLRRDGRALRYVPDKVPAVICEEFKRRVKMIADDLNAEPSLDANRIGKVYLGDGRRPHQVLPKEIKADLVLFSPPYPNNIDYTEVYKMEAWLLGIFSDQQTFYEQRLRTLRSHPSVRFSNHYYSLRNGYKSDFVNLLDPLLQEIPKNKNLSWRTNLVKGYFDDMLVTLISHKKILSKNGYLVFVVGNSLHGSEGEKFLIAADLIIARLAELAGYRVKDFIIARLLTRKGNNSLLHRESVVILKNHK